MDWEFQTRAQAGDSDGASKSRIIIEGDHTITPFEVFVREVLQNSLDAAQHGKLVRVHFKLHRIVTAEAKATFLNAFGWPILRERVEAANRIKIANDQPAEFGDPSDLEARPIEAMEISERGTIGLVGPESINSEEEERRKPDQPPRAYIALTRDDARREKQGLGSGGTYGLGKAVLWAASQVQTVIFFSRLSIPDKGGSFRAAAQARLGPHYLEAGRFRGLGYGGNMKDGWCRPIVDIPAQALAKNLGIDRRTHEDEVGTSILIPFWSDPESEDAEGVASYVRIARYAARYFWPAIIDGKLEVTTEDHTGKRQSAKDHLHNYQPFISLYSRMRDEISVEQDSAPENIKVIVPAGPPPQTAKEKETHMRVGMAFVAENEEVREDFCRKVACIRGQGMVVGYARMTGNTLVRPFVGLALGGRAADKSENGIRGDVLLGYSEYVTHTKWDERSASLRHWPSARPVVRDLLQKLRDYFERNSRVEQPDTNNDMSPLEAGLRFPGPGKIGQEHPPIEGTPKLRLHSFRRGRNCYEFEVRARVEAKNPRMTLDLWIEPAVETGVATKEDRFSISKIRVVPASLEPQLLENGKLRLVIPELQQDTQITVTAATVELPRQVFEISEGLLKATIHSGQSATDASELVEDEHD